MTRIILTAENPEDVQLVLALAKRLDIAVVVDQEIDPALDESAFWELIERIDLSSEAVKQIEREHIQKYVNQYGKPPRGNE